MGRVSTVKKLKADQHLAVDACIRRHRFVNIDAIRCDLTESGIEISRTALHRYMQKLAVRDGLHLGTPDDTMVIVIERSTGAMTSLTTTASRQMVVALIGDLKAPT